MTPTAPPRHNQLAAPTVHCGCYPRWLRPCRNTERVPLREQPACDFRQPPSRSAKSAAGSLAAPPRKLRGTPLPAELRVPSPSLRVAVADCAREDGPALEPLPVAKTRGERSRTFPCKHAPVQFGFHGFDLLYRLWTLPYNLLTRVVCATVSAIVRRRRASPARVDHHHNHHHHHRTAPRCPAARASFARLPFALSRAISSLCRPHFSVFFFFFLSQRWFPKN